MIEVGRSNAVRDVANELQNLLLGPEDVENFLQHLVDIAVASFGADVSAAVTLDWDGGTALSVGSDPHAGRCDEVQYDYDDGPCLVAIGTGEVIVIDELAEGDRFSKYRQHAHAAGVRSCLSVPLDSGTGALGALNLYSTRPQAFGLDEQTRANQLAAEASRGLNVMVRLARHTKLNDQLRTALTSRAVIDQAIGIVMAQNRCDADESFAILRAASQNRNVKLRLLAAEIITAVSRKPPSEGHALSTEHL